MALFTPVGLVVKQRFTQVTPTLRKCKFAQVTPERSRKSIRCVKRRTKVFSGNFPGRVFWNKKGTRGTPLVLKTKVVMSKVVCSGLLTPGPFRRIAMCFLFCATGPKMKNNYSKPSREIGGKVGQKYRIFNAFDLLYPQFLYGLEPYFRPIFIILNFRLCSTKGETQEQLRWLKSPIASVQRTRSSLASHSAVSCGTNAKRTNNHGIRIATQRTQGL